MLNYLLLSSFDLKILGLLCNKFPFLSYYFPYASWFTLIQISSCTIHFEACFQPPRCKRAACNRETRLSSHGYRNTVVAMSGKCEQLFGVILQGLQLWMYVMRVISAGEREREREREREGSKDGRISARVPTNPPRHRRAICSPWQSPRVGPSDQLPDCILRSKTELLVLTRMLSEFLGNSF
jgi:hypothetical protein